MKIREKIIMWLHSQPDWVIATIVVLIIAIPATVVGIIFGK